MTTRYYPIEGLEPDEQDILIDVVENPGVLVIDACALVAIRHLSKLLRIDLIREHEHGGQLYPTDKAILLVTYAEKKD